MFITQITTVSKSSLLSQFTGWNWNQESMHLWIHLAQKQKSQEKGSSQTRLMASRQSYHLWHQQPIRVLVCILIAPLPVEFSDCGLEKHWKTAQVLEPLPPVWETQMILMASAWLSLGWYKNLENKWTDGNPIPSLSTRLSKQINVFKVSLWNPTQFCLKSIVII